MPSKLSVHDEPTIFVKGFSAEYGWQVECAVCRLEAAEREIGRLEGHVDHVYQDLRYHKRQLLAASACGSLRWLQGSERSAATSAASCATTSGCG